MVRLSPSTRAAFALGTALSLAAAAPAPLPAPQLGKFGFDDTGVDKRVRPGDDFNRYVSGAWEARTEIPADKYFIGSFVVLDDLSKERTRTLLEGDAARAAPGTATRKAADYFRAYMDEAAIEAKGSAPLRAEIAELTAFTDAAGLARALGTAERRGIKTPFDFGIGVDDKNPDVYLAALGQGGLGLPDRDYYLKDNAQFTAARAMYKANVAKMLTLAGYPDPAGNAERIYALEVEIAKVHRAREDLRDADKNYNKMAFTDLPQRAPGFDWAGFAQGLGVQSLANLNVGQPDALGGEARVIAATPLPTWKAYIALRAAQARAAVLPKAFVDTNFELQKALTGQQVLEDRWKRGVGSTSNALGEAVGPLYVAKYFPPASKAAADKLVANVLGAMRARLQNLQWMDPATRAKALVKLAAFRPKIGYTTKWRDYGRLQVRADDAYGNRLRATAFEFDRELRRVNDPADRGEWFMTPMTINAYANPTWNEIVFPAAILQPPFFDAAADPAINYGAIGAVIGHEISHHFDDQGRKYDEHGRLASWWTPADVARFDKLTAPLVAQYFAYEPLPGQKINGKLTLGENIADVVGLQVAHDAYVRSLGGKPAPVVGGLTGDQRFYLGWAQVWRSKWRPQVLQLVLTSDPHSPGEYRVATVRNHDLWYQAFGVKPGDKQYLPPEQRIRIW